MSANRTGENHHSLTINDSIAKEIKLLIYHGYRHQNIATYFGISKSSVNDIKNNGSWKHIQVNESDIRSYNPLILRDASSRLNESDVVILKFSTKSICELLKLEKTFVNRVKSGKIRRS